MSVKLYTDAATGRGFAVTIPKERLQKFDPSVHYTGSDPVRLTVKACRGVDGQKAARVALKYIHSDKESSTPLLQYYAGHLYILELKIIAERKIFEGLHVNLPAPYLQEVLQASLLGQSRTLALKVLSLLLLKKDATHSLVKLVSKMRRYYAGEFSRCASPEDIEEVKRRFSGRIQKEQQTIIRCLKEYNRNLTRSDATAEEQRKINAVYRETIQRMDDLVRENDSQVELMIGHRRSVIEDDEKELRPIPGERAVLSLVPAVKLIDTPSGIALHITHGVNEDFKFRQILGELKRVFPIQALYVSGREIDNVFLKQLGGKHVGAANV